MLYEYLFAMNIHLQHVNSFLILNTSIHKFQECRAAGCRTLAEVKMYTDQKRKKELELSAQKSKESGQVVAGGKAIQKGNRPMNREKGESDGSPRNTMDNHKVRGGSGVESGGKDSPVPQTSARSFDEWNITGLPGAELLSETVRMTNLVLSIFLLNRDQAYFYALTTFSALQRVVQVLLCFRVYVHRHFCQIFQKLNIPSVVNYCHH